jgi:hypothetical protein
MRSALDRVPALGVGVQSKFALGGIYLVKVHRDGMTQAEVAAWVAEGLTAGDASFAAVLTGIVALVAFGHDLVRGAMLFCRPDPNLTNR